MGVYKLINDFLTNWYPLGMRQRYEVHHDGSWKFGLGPKWGHGRRRIRKHVQRPVLLEERRPALRWSYCEWYFKISNQTFNLTKQSFTNTFEAYLELLLHY